MSGLNLKKDEIQKQLAEKIKAANCFCLTNITARTGKIRMVLKYILTPEDSAVVIYPELDIRQSWVDDIKNWEFGSCRRSNSKSVLWDIPLDFYFVPKVFRVYAIFHFHVMEHFIEHEKLAMCIYCSIN